MRNKIFAFIFFLNFIYTSVYADTFFFEANNIEIKEKGNLIIASKGTASTSNQDILIYAEDFKYLKNLNILNVYGNGKAELKSKKILIEFDEGKFDQNKNLIHAKGNVIITNLDNDYKISSNEIIFDQIKNIFNSRSKTILLDKFENVYKFDKFEFKVENNILKANNLEIVDKRKNVIKTELAYINTKSGKLFGKDLIVNLKDKSGLPEESDPRLKANVIIKDNNTIELKKGTFTSCKKRDGCSPWLLSAQEIQHDNEKKIINYKNAILRIYDFPIMYFPKFFHPDPSVKRQSGFLTPTFKNSNNSGNFFKTPYFLAIAENKDATFSPRFYNNEKILLQSEYRQVNNKSNHIADFSILTEKSNNSKSHFFYNFKKNFYMEKFDENELFFKVQKTSNDTYLKKDKLESELINDTDFLENSLTLNFNSKDTSVSLNTNIYENLDKKRNDRYEYVFPKINFTRTFQNLSDLFVGNFTIKSEALNRNYETNKFERKLMNDLYFKSYAKVSDNGLVNDYEFLIKNSNSKNKNTSYKNNENIYMSSLFQLNSSLPLVKNDKNYKKVLKPKISLKLAPRHTKDSRRIEKKIDINNIHSIDRLSDETIEGGASATVSSNFSIMNNKNSNEIFALQLASNLRMKENKDLPSINQIGDKTSNIFTDLNFNPNKYFTIGYNNSLKNNLSEVSNENFETNFQVNNFISKFNYTNENNTAAKNSFIKNETSYFLDDFNSFNFSTRKNKTKDLTEYYNFMYQYKTDCLAASIEYQKDFYNDRDFKPSKNLFLKLTIIPLGETTSPNLNN